MLEEPPQAPPVRPLHDVWLKPRRVFRELAAKPVGTVDYLLGAAQGTVSWLALSRAQSAGSTSSVEEILGKALGFGSILGVASLFLMAAIYARLGKRTGAPSTRTPVFHVLAYGGIPMVASLGIWLVTALLAGEATFVETPRPDTEGFIVLLLRVQFFAHALLLVWSLVLQVMGFSEVQGLPTRRAFGIWLLGQVLAALAMLVLAVVISSLIPLAAPT